MAKPSPLQNTWHQGMKRDYSRSNMPSATLWNAVDVIANYGAPLRSRAGWTNHSQDIASVTAASATHIRAGIFATFATSGGAEVQRNLAIDEDGHLFDVTTASAATDIGSALTVLQNPVFHGGTAVSAVSAIYTGLVIIPDGTGAAGPMKYDGTTLSSLNGTPPAARYATVFKDYTALGNGTVAGTYYPNRTWFSPEGDPDCFGTSGVTAWDTTDSWLDLSLAVKGYGATRNALLVFHDTQVSRIRGSIPPPDTDFVVDDGQFKVGLFDPMSIVEHRDQLYWAAPEGVFRSDAAVLDDMTKRGGMLRYWLDLTRDATSTWTFAGGVHRENYILAVMDGTTFKDAFAIDLQTLAWTRLSNFDVRAFWNGSFGTGDELYFGRRGAARVCRTSTIYQVGDTTYSFDGDGDPILPVIETPFYSIGNPGAKRIRRAFVTYEVDDYPGADASATLSYILTPESTSYTDITTTLAENTKAERVARDIRKQGLGVGFKLTRTGAGDLFLYSLEAEANSYEPSRRIR